MRVVNRTSVGLALLLAVLLLFFAAFTPAFAQQDLNCDDFNSQAEAQAELEANPSDPNNLDADNDSMACDTFDFGGEGGTTPPGQTMEETTTEETTTEETTQQGTTAEETTAPTVPDGNEGCDSPQEIVTFEGNDNQLTDQFSVTGDTFRVRFDVETTDPNGFPELDIDVLDESGEPIGQSVLTFEDDGSENILAGPGSFSLDIRANDVSYEIAVDDCSGAANDGNGGGTTDNDGDAGNDDDSDDDVIDDTIPDKDLPNTGGSLALVVGGAVLLLLYGVLVAWRLKSRER